MYEDIYGQGEGLDTFLCVLKWVILVTILVLVVLIYVAVTKEKMTDYGIRQRGDVVAAVPAYEEESLRQRLDRAVQNVGTSNLTGSRDVPVFFQDHNVEMSRVGGGAVANTREGFEGGKNEDELHRALAGQ